MFTDIPDLAVRHKDLWRKTLNIYGNAIYCFVLDSESATNQTGKSGIYVSRNINFIHTDTP